MKTLNNQNGVKHRHSLFPQIQIINSCNKDEIGTAEEQTLVTFEIKATKLKRTRKKVDAFPDSSFLKSPNLFKKAQKELMISFNCEFSGKDECLITIYKSVAN
ncbi:MAG: hypothetical protein IPO07_07120 [Haliscomenobacter sp.]|nr:hypothetical protein [Haliscomenobacter sp.]MBK9488572.1 hypothetical protein [Haliscomenobacter sp.]